MNIENKLPYAHRSRDFKYLLDNEIGKTLCEVCQDKANRKAAKEAALYQLQNLAKKLTAQMTQMVRDLRNGEMDIVTLIERMEEMREQYKKSASDETISQYLSQHEIQLIWNNSLKREQQSWWSK